MTTDQGAAPMPEGPRSIIRRAALPVLVVVGALSGSLTVASGGVAAMDAPAPASAPAPEVAKAPDAPSAVAAAMRQGSRVEVTGEGTETRTVWANPDGTHSAEITAVPTRVKRGDEWVAIDPTLVLRTDGSVGPRAAPGAAVLSGGGQTTPLIRLTAGPTELALHWPGELPRPVLSGNQATYPEVLPGVDLVMRAEVPGYQQLLVIKTAEAARNPALASVGMRVETRGVRLSADESGALRAVDDTGQLVFASPPSVMWDSSGPDSATSRWARVGVAVNDGELSLAPDQRFLADPATKYPVTVDPTPQSVGWGEWATALSGNGNQRWANQTFWRTSGAGPDVVQVGQCNNSRGDCNGIGEARAFFQFETGFLGDKDVLEGSFHSTVMWSPDCVTVREHELWVLHAPIRRDLTWNNQPAGLKRAEFAAPYMCDGRKGVELNVMGALNGAGPTTFYLMADNGSDQLAWRKYVPSETKLNVKWNRRPNNPRNVHTDPPMPQPCHHCGGVPYVSNNTISLKATLDDPDGDALFPRWRIQVQDRSLQVRERPTWPGIDFQMSGATHNTNLDLTDLHDKWVGWWVHGDDGVRASDLTSGQTFVVDRKGPEAEPEVDSAAYPEDNDWHGRAGEPGVFTLKPGKPCDAQNTHGTCDVDHYLYSWNGGPFASVDADALGGNATVTLAPPADGTQTLHVQSVDRAGNQSSLTKHHRVYVRAGNGPRSLWSFEGNPRDTAFLGDRHGTLAGGVGYGPGAVGTALRLDGSGGSIASAPSAFRTDSSFTVSAWVRPDVLSGSMTPLSQDGASTSAWLLDYSHDFKTWSFLLTGYAAGEPGRLTHHAVRGRAGQPTVGEWSHLTAVYDRPNAEIRLYVDGVRVGVQSVAGFTPQLTAGPLTVGRMQWDGNFHNQWFGSVDEVGVYDRVLSDAEVRAVVGRDNVRTGHWTFDDRSGGTARSSVAGGVDGELRNGAAFTATGLVGGAVTFDGKDDFVATNVPVVRTDQSFSVSAWVRPNQAPPAGQSMTVVSQDGGHPGGNSGFYLQWNGAGPWMFIMAGTETGGAQWHGSSSRQVARVGEPVQLTGVYDAATRKLVIYVNGEEGHPVTLPADAWNATGPLVVGRAKSLGRQVDFVNGLIDDVRTYNRVLTSEEIAAIGRQSGVSNGLWKLDGNTEDASGRNLTGTWSGTPQWMDGRVTDPDSTDKAARLTGSNAISAPNAVDTRDSFTVAAWVRPDAATGCHCTVVSQDAGTSAGFSLAAGGEGEWSIFASAADPNDRPPPGDWAIGDKGQVQAGEWTHLAGIYDRRRGTLDLYVNGARVKTTEHKTTVHAAGSLQIGRIKWQGRPGYVNDFVGAIDDVQVYNRALFADEIREMAGRDLSLVHNWRFNNTTTDSIGPRVATLHGDARYDAGRAGRSIALDGNGDGVSTSGVDLRTDQSFTVSAWVNLATPGVCTGECRRTAVSLDGGPTAESPKFRLGHIINDDQAPAPGKWIFEMPEAADGSVTEAAISVRRSQLDKWVLLVGTYDAATGRLELYVYTDDPDAEPDHDFGLLQRPWQGTGGLQIGRTLHRGAASEFWKGGVDDVRVYAEDLSPARVKALYDSYPAAVTQ